MATRAIKPRRDDTILTGWQSMPETAPSVLRQDQPTVARVLAMVGVMLTAVGLLALLAPGMEWRYIVAPGWGAFFLSIGLVLILYHAFVDKDVQFRRVYMFFGLLLAGVGVLCGVLPRDGAIAGWFLPYGFYALTLALLMLVAVARHETDVNLRLIMLRIVGVLGAVMIMGGLIVGQFNADFLSGQGIVLLILGLFYYTSFIGLQDARDDFVDKAAAALGLVGGVSLFVTLARVLWPMIFPAETDSTFLVPSGLVLIGISVLYICVAVGIWSDRPLVVLLRRELSAFFYSPMAYLVLVAMLLVAWVNFIFFVDFLTLGTMFPEAMQFEPIVRRFIVDLIPVIAQMFVVPILTMRLLSEEKRTGTLEMMLTVPVNETTLTLSKFLAAWIFYLLTWLPTFLLLVALRALTEREFDYRPLLSFQLTIMATGAGFIAMGVFFSSLTRNQVVAAVFTFVGMTLHLGLFIIAQNAQDPESLISNVNFVNLWWRSLDGILAPRYLLIHVSLAVFFLYLTNKVLEARKWS